MISLATPQDYNQLKSIWIEVFTEAGFDAADYADTFMMGHQNHSALVYRQDGLIASMLFLIPCFWDGSRGYYVYACATLLKYRGKGLMGILLNAAFEKAQRENMFGLILIPANPPLFDFYKKYGYKPFSDISESVFYSKDVPNDFFCFSESKNPEQINQIRNRVFDQHEAVQFETSHIDFIQNHVVNNSGATLFFSTSEKSGYAFCIFDEIQQRVFVLEWALISDAFHNNIPKFFQGICRYFHVQELYIRSKSGLLSSLTRPFTMIRLCLEKPISKNVYFNLGMD